MMAADYVIGLASAFGAVVLFGSNYIPVKQYDVGDGLFFQWVLCCGIWIIGVVVSLLHSSMPPPMEPLAVLGGVIWATGHLSVVPIIRSIGMAKGLIIWGATAMITGWTCGIFGIAGVRSEAGLIHSWALNLSGLLLSLASLGCSLLLRPRSVSAPIGEHFLDVTERTAAGNLKQAAQSHPVSAATGTCLALGAGIFFGVAFNPATYVMQHAGTAEYPTASTHALDYVPSQFSGILLAATVYFALYAALNENRPSISPQVALPALVSGLLWGAADALWFVAIEKLGFVVAFPIVLAGPGSVASLWGIFVLDELPGTHNKIVAALVTALVTAAASLISLSRMD